MNLTQFVSDSFRKVGVLITFSPIVRNVGDPQEEFQSATPAVLASALIIKL